jgi:hypothetical protein
MAEHTVKAFDTEIGQLRGLIAEMGGIAELMIRDSINALSKPTRNSMRWRPRSTGWPCG